MPFVIVLTPEHRLDATIAVAALRAGECGVLDLGFSEAADPMAQEIQRLAAEPGEWGVRWDTQGLDTRGAERLAELLSSPVSVLILAGLAFRPSYGIACPVLDLIKIGSIVDIEAILKPS
jgi:hypothetical protein